MIALEPIGPSHLTSRRMLMLVYIIPVVHLSDIGRTQASASWHGPGPPTFAR